MQLRTFFKCKKSQTQTMVCILMKSPLGYLFTQMLNAWPQKHAEMLHHLESKRKKFNPVVKNKTKITALIL